MVNLSPVPLFDLSRETAHLRSGIDAAIGRVLDSGRVILASEHEAFERELAEASGVAEAIGVANGTDALEIALAALGVRSGSTVVTVANAGGYTSVASYRLGATPVYCDVDPGTLLMSAETLQALLAALSEAPSAIVVTHLFGGVAPMPDIMRVAREHGIPVLEDCAQSTGSLLGGQPAGSFGDIATTSFYPTKNLGALGDGGALLTHRADLATFARDARQYGWSAKYRVDRDYGRNSRLDELQAAILRVKLGALGDLVARRRAVFARYAEANPGALVHVDQEAHAPHLAVIRTTDRPAVERRFAELGIGTGVHYPVLDHHQPAWTAHAPVSLAASEQAVHEILSVPMFPFLTHDEVERVAAALTELSG